jgi:hypothetical protein
VNAGKSDTIRIHLRLSRRSRSRGTSPGSARIRVALLFKKQALITSLYAPKRTAKWIGHCFDHVFPPEFFQIILALFLILNDQERFFDN